MSPPPTAWAIDAPSVGRRVTAAREAVVAAALAAFACGLVLAVGPPGGDAAAHFYRTLLVRDGAFVWDNLWYAGQYPLASYSLLYYLPAAVVGNVPLVFGAGVVAAALFASIAVREWGDAARWPARAFGLLAAGPLLTGSYAYGLGLAALLAALWALQRGRIGFAVAFTALTLGFSPLAFVFLLLVLAAALVARPRRARRYLWVAAAVALLGGLEVAVLVLFPTQAVYPFSAWRLGIVLALSALCWALARRAESARPLALLCLAWSAASALAFLVPSPLGQNLTRLSALIFPVMLLAASLAGFRPRLLALAALSLAFAYNVFPYAALAVDRTSDGSAQSAYWQPLLGFLHRHSGPGYRVEAVPTVNHWDAYFLPQAGFAIARGWYRQLDLTENPALYRNPLRPAAYRAWLRRMGVEYVVLLDEAPAPMGADREADLLTSGRSGLRRAFRSSAGTIYALPRPTSIINGPGPATITALGHGRVAGRAARPGVYRLSLNYTPYWRVRGGSVCVAPTADGMTKLDVRRAGRFALTVPEHPSALLHALVDRGDASC